MEFQLPRLWLFPFLVVGSAVVHSPCLAQEKTSPVSEAPTQSTSVTEAPSMIVDPESKSFRFFIDGREVARIDARGLQVRENISYGGYIEDYGPSGFDASIDGARDDD